MGLRLLAVVPAVFCTAALILSFLCLFAGSKRGFMEDYAVLTLNTSQIGQDLPLFDEINSHLDSLDRRDAVAELEPVLPMVTPAPQLHDARAIEERDFTSKLESLYSEGTAGVASLYTKATGAIPVPTQAVAALDWLKSEGHELTEELVQEAENLTDKFEHYIEDGLGDLAQVLGIYDFYSAHILTFCEGYYVPGSVPNATVKASSIHRNVTHCSNTTAMAHFDPTKEISQQLNESTDGFIDLTNVQWPDDIQHALNALQAAQKAVFILYCIGIGLIFLAMAAASAGLFFNGRLSALINVLLDLLAFIATLIASALVTVIAIKGAHAINKYGKDIGVSATKGGKFLALTWSATALMFLAMLVWTYMMFTGSRSKSSRRREMQEKR